MVNPRQRRSGPCASRRVLFTMLVGMLAAAACARSDNWVQTYPDIAANARRDPQSFVAAAHARWDELHGMVGSYQVRANRGVSSRTLDTQIYLLRDAMVQIEVLAPTGTSEGYLAVGRREVGFWVSEENVLYRGANDAGAFGRALGLDLAPQDVVAVLMGYGVRPGGDATIDWDEGQQRIRVRRAGVTAWLHPVSAVFDRVVVDAGSGPIEIDYEAWSDEGPPVPLRMSVRVAAEDITLQLRLAPAWYANPEGLDEAFFDIIVPTRAAVESLDRLSSEGGLLRRGLER